MILNVFWYNCYPPIMLEFTLIDISWNHYNGFLFKLLEFDHRLMPGNERALFGINFAGKDFLYISILFFNLKIYDKHDERH